TVSAVMDYLGNQETRTTQFQVLGPPVSQLSVSIDANTTTISENGAIRFIPIVSGNISAVSYNWDFQNDHSVDSTQSEINYTYPTNGTYIVNLTVSDTNSTKSAYKLIRVRKAFSVTVLVRDNSTLGTIVGAAVKLDDEEIITNGEGRSVFLRPEDRYDLIVRKTGYRTFSNKTDLKEGQTIEVNLFEEDKQAPTITLSGPGDNASVSDSKVQFKYTATDKNAISCRLDMNFNSEGWMTKATSSSVTSNSESTFDIEGLQNGTHYWQVRCNDNQGNTNTSSIFSLYYSSSQPSQPQAESESLDFAATIVNLDDYDSMILNIDNAISNLDSLSSDEKEAAEAFGLRKKLEKAKLAIQRTERDLDSLKWRKLNETELDEEKQKILDGLKDVTSDTPSQIEIIDKNEFVKYPNKEDVRKAMLVLLNQTNKKLSKSELSDLVQQNFKLQSMITATTKTKVLGVTYLTGQKETITLVQKLISKSKDFERLVFWEVIPKEVAKDSSEYEFLSEKETIEEDPILQVDISKNKEFSYYIKRKVGNFDLEGIKSIVLDPNIKVKEKGFITGFLSFDNFSKDFLTGSDFRLIIEVMAIVLLLLVFAYYQFGGSEFLSSALNPHVRKQLREFDSLKDQISHNLDLNKYEDSKPLYRELSAILTGLPKDAKVKIYPTFMDVHAKMDFVFMQNSLKSAMEIIEKDKTKAAETYMKISGLYKGLPKDYKSKVHLQCIDLHNRLSQKRS
ncbi:MAG TPA: PKD domain-containing protein, partial [Candidatus Nanoarchaeia archaeon]|nr:PKD domain-containing protein [Candidatus Nanoarchaeia archaeon]